MANLTITGTGVKPNTTGYKQVGTKTAGGTITAGETLYLNSTDGFVLPASSNIAAVNAVVIGVAMNPASTGQLVIVGSGQIIIGATVVVGSMYVQAEAAGGIAPNADLATSDYVTYLGQAISTTVIDFEPDPTGVQHA